MTEHPLLGPFSPQEQEQFGIDVFGQLIDANDEEQAVKTFEDTFDFEVGSVARVAVARGVSLTEAMQIIIENNGDLLAAMTGAQEPPSSQGAGNALGFAQLEEIKKQGTFDRARDRMRLLQATDELLDARRESAIDAMIAAAPFMIDPGMEFFPGEEPGGLGAQLDQRLGGAGAVQPGRIPQVELPLNQLVNAPVSAGPEAIDQALLPLLNS